jgi:hypothetical protein
VLPEGALSRWDVSGPQEIVTWLIFDPATVAGSLPASLRFVTIGEVAGNRLPWAVEHLDKHPDQANWGISFFEIVRTDTFAIDGRQPRWPSAGAAALWCARVAPAEAGSDLGPGQAFLLLEFWLPDRDYCRFMRERGHYASYGDVRLRRNRSGEWAGEVRTDRLQASGACLPTGAPGSSSGGGMQVFFPPQHSGLTTLVRLAFAGHRIQSCASSPIWKFEGDHPLTRAMVLGETTFQFGYRLDGGAYRPDGSTPARPNRAPQSGQVGMDKKLDAQGI